MARDGDSQRGPSRRAVLRSGAVLAGGLVGAGGLLFATMPVFAISPGSFTARDRSVTTADGTVDDVYLKPRLVVGWNGLDADATAVWFAVSVSGPDGAVTELTDPGPRPGRNDLSGTSGRAVYAFKNRLSLIDGGPWVASDFRADEDDSSRTVSGITVHVEATLEDDAGVEYVDNAADDFAVTVTNAPAEFGGGDDGDGDDTGVGGHAGTGVLVGGGDD